MKVLVLCMVETLVLIKWNGEVGENQELTFTRKSAHLEGGFPGNLELSVTYRLFEDDTVEVTYEGITDQTTIVNVTNHSY